MKLSKEKLELLESVRKDLESKGVIADTMRAEVIENDVDFTLIAKLPDGNIWEIVEVEQRKG